MYTQPTWTKTSVPNCGLSLSNLTPGTFLLTRAHLQWYSAPPNRWDMVEKTPPPAKATEKRGCDAAEVFIHRLCDTLSHIRRWLGYRHCRRNCPMCCLGSCWTGTPSQNAACPRSPGWSAGLAPGQRCPILARRRCVPGWVCGSGLAGHGTGATAGLSGRLRSCRGGTKNDLDKVRRVRSRTKNHRLAFIPPFSGLEIKSSSHQ